MDKEKKFFLVMDGEPHMCAYLKRFIQYYFDYEVECVSNYEYAIHNLGARVYEGLLLDTGTGDGEEVLTWLKANNRHEPVIMMSHGADYEMLTDFVNRGAADLIAKPVQPSELKRTIKLILREKDHENASGGKIDDPLYMTVEKKHTSTNAVEVVMSHILGIHGWIHRLNGALDSMKWEIKAEDTEGIGIELAERSVERMYLELACIREKLRAIKTEPKGQDLQEIRGGKKNYISPNSKTIRPSRSMFHE
jgi:DNA-binding NarL/FixJ family response regulator